MITARQPEHWRELQQEVAQVLAQCQIDVEIEKTVRLARGSAEIDVYAVETVRGRTVTIFCECKNWRASVPQHVVHSFRSIVADGGANVGYLITSSAFQRGAFTAAELTSLRLVTWQEFQAEFEQTWVTRYLRPKVTERLDPLFTYVEPILPRSFDSLSRPRKRAYLAVRDRHLELGALAMLFTTAAEQLSLGLPELPLRERFRDGSIESTLPPEILDAVAYRDLLDVLLPCGESAIGELRAALTP